jgi:hypothetical protein
MPSKYSRGSHLGATRQSDASREQRQQQIAERNRALRQEKTKKYAKMLGLIAGVALILIAVFFLQRIRFDSDSVAEPYRGTIDSYFAQNSLAKSQFFFNAEDLKSYITDKHPEVGEISVSSGLMGQLSVDIKSRQAGFLWAVNSQTFIGDDQGVIYAPADDENASDDMLLLRDQSGVTPEIGSKVISSSALEYARDLNDELSKSNLKVDYFSIPNESREIHMHIVGKPYFVKFSLDRSVVGQTSELQQAIEFIDSSNISFKQYIDLRTEDKAYYQ